MARRVAVAWALALAVTATARAQSGPSGTSAGQSTTTTQTQSSSTETRPATTTFFGDTGLWFVPTGEVLPGGKVSASVYRRGTNWIEGYTNVADFAGTFAFGIKNRAEIFGSLLVDTRIDRDVRPIFVADPVFGSFIDRYPRVNRVWYPGLACHPTHHIAASQMTGFGGLISFTVKGTTADASRAIDALKIPYLAPSLGGTEAFVEQPALMSYYDKTPEELEAIGITGELIRFSAGLEDADELIADLDQALRSM